MRNLKDREVVLDYEGEEAIGFNPKWYRIDRWFWWLFICGNSFSKWKWVLIDNNHQAMRAYQLKEK
jgi:hypothetical protein